MIKALIPVRAGSQRIKNKNIRSFAGSNLLDIKIKQLKRIKKIDEIIVNSDSAEMLEIAKKNGVTAIKRDPYFASDHVPMNDVWAHLAETTDAAHIMYTNCTNPLVKDTSYISAIEKYFNLPDKYDSLTTVNCLQEYLWDGDACVNYDPTHHPRSQDLPKLCALNFAISIIPKHLMVKNKSILGNCFYKFEISHIESIDIDTIEDFIIAESAYISLVKDKK